MHLTDSFEDNSNNHGLYRYVNRLRAYGLDPSLEFKSETESSVSQPSCVWLTCDDSVLEPVLSRLEDDNSVIVLRTNGRPLWMPGCWPIDQSLRLTYSLAESSVRAMVVCGHSRCAGEDADSQRKISRWLRRSDGVVERVAHQQSLQRLARDLFAERICEMQQLPTIARAVDEKGISFCGMWYLQETGFWMRYTPEGGWNDSACQSSQIDGLESSHTTQRRIWE